MDQLKAVEVCIDSYDLRMHEMKVYFNEFLGQADFTEIAQANAIPIIFEAGETATTVTVPITNQAHTCKTLDVVTTPKSIASTRNIIHARARVAQCSVL